MSRLHDARLIFRRAGIDIGRFPDPAGPAVRRSKMLASNRVDFVFDVGAAVGDYGLELRRTGYSGCIVSCEPLAVPFANLERKARSECRWEALNVAVGSFSGEIRINIAGNSNSSSVLPMLPAHVEAAPGSAYTGSTSAPQVTLDALILERNAERPFVKIDVQGYEHAVLDGACDTIGKIVGVQVELSLIPLYEGQLLADAMIDRLRALGFSLWGIEPGFASQATGRMLQMDGVFFRADRAD